MPNWLEATPNMYKKPVKTVEKAPNYSLDEQRLRKLAKWCAEAGEIKESDLILKFTKEFGVGVATFHKLRPYLLQMYPQISTIPGEREYHYDKMNNNNNNNLEKKNNNMENKISLSTNPGEN
tara:strand:+ start:712 stop:1077 length:366 start_codon:yes stop_codon:yes gene_type:complete